MGEEELELLRAAASQQGLQLATLNWILASLANHGFVTISSIIDDCVLLRRRQVIWRWLYAPHFPWTMSIKR